MKCKNCNEREAEIMWYVYEICRECFDLLKKKSGEIKEKRPKNSH